MENLEKETLDLLKKYVAQGKRSPAILLERIVKREYPNSREEAASIMSPMRGRGVSTNTTGRTFVRAGEEKKRMELGKPTRRTFVRSNPGGRLEQKDVAPEVSADMKPEELATADISTSDLFKKTQKEIMEYFGGSKDALLNFAEPYDVGVNGRHAVRTIISRLRKKINGSDEEE